MKPYVIVVSREELELLTLLVEAAANERRGYEHDIAGELGYEPEDFQALLGKVSVAQFNNLLDQKQELESAK